MSTDPLPEKEDLAQDNSPAESKSAQATSMHLYFPCGIIRGALQNLGIPCAVTANISNLPACEYWLLSALDWKYFFAHCVTFISIP